MGTLESDVGIFFNFKEICTTKMIIAVFCTCIHTSCIDGDIHAALAAYNAGPGNAARWYELAGSDIDQFIDVMDFWETRTYVERIYAGFDIYRSLYEP